MTNAELLATAVRKSAAHAGLADALETGRVRVLRVDGVDTLIARSGDGRDFRVTFDNLGNGYCAGFVLGGSAAPLAFDALRRARG